MGVYFTDYIPGPGYRGIQLKSGGPLFEPAMQPLMDHLITPLSNRYESNEGIIRATELLNLNSWHEKESTEVLKTQHPQSTICTA